MVEPIFSSTDPSTSREALDDTPGEQQRARHGRQFLVALDSGGGNGAPVLRRHARGVRPTHFTRKPVKSLLKISCFVAHQVSLGTEKLALLARRGRRFSHSPTEREPT